MILYRLTTFPNDEADSWCCEWHGTKDEARKSFLDAHRSGIPSVVHKVDVPTDKMGLVLALERSHDNPTNYPFIMIEVFSSRREQKKEARQP